MKHFDLTLDSEIFLEYDNPRSLTLVSMYPCLILHNGQVITGLPGGMGNPTYQLSYRPGDELILTTLHDGNICRVFDHALRRHDPHDSESLVEVLEPGELTLYDKLRNEMLSYLSQTAQNIGHETAEEADDFNVDDPDDLIRTPYEINDYEVLEEELPIYDDLPQGEVSKKPLDADPSSEDPSSNQQSEAPSLEE